MDIVALPERLQTERPNGTPSIFADATRAIRDALRTLPAAEQVRAVSSVLASLATEMSTPTDQEGAPVPIRFPSVSREGLTDRQSEVVTVIERHIAKKGRPPTLREIGKAMGITSTNGVNDHLKALRRKGILAYEPMKARGVRLLTATCVTCGNPCDVEQWVAGGGAFACSPSCLKARVR